MNIDFEEPAAGAQDARPDAEEENVSRLRCGGKEIILIATAHISLQSVALVKRVIEAERPSSVCIELDDDRLKNIEDPDAWKKTDIVKVIKAKKVGFLFANLILSSYQKKMAGKIGARVGQEMIQGMESAKTVGATLVPADRKIQTTFLRIWRKLGGIEKAKLLSGLLFSFGEDAEITEDDLQELLRGDMLEAAMGDIRKKYPKVGDILIRERDRYLADKIKNAPGGKVVAVLGGAHVPGVREEIFKEQDVAEISEIPPASPVGKAVAWLIPILIVALIAYGFTQGASVGLSRLGTWLIWTSALAAGFTALSLGHPLTVLTAFVVAPFTVLHPFLACGWFAGLAEAFIRKPTVADIENVPEVILSVKGFFKNRFLRIILIVAMANIGASIGTFVAGLDIIKSLFLF
ncbi:MAG: TraB/GumN family protein [Clostridiales Family XIII bacterium]|nr:TraB/GumN family protein [Clostridiales Family XIII bacterium]